MWAVDNGHLEAVKYLVEKGKASLAVINKVIFLFFLINYFITYENS